MKKVKQLVAKFEIEKLNESNSKLLEMKMKVILKNENCL